MDQDGHQGPDGFESPESEEGWYFDLPNGAWERQEEKNRELRERIRGNITQSAAHEPFRGRRARPEEETRGGLAGWAARHMDDPDPAPQAPEPAPAARRDDEPLAAWAGDGWDDPEASALWQDDDSPAPAPTVEDPFAESGDDFGDPELINAMRAWANQHDAPEAASEPPVIEPADAPAPNEPEDIGSAMRAWATAAPAGDTAEAGPAAYSRRGEYQSSWRREKPVSGEPSRWQEAFEGAPRGENMLDSMRAWAENGPVLPPDQEEVAPPVEIPEEFLKPFDWELEETAATTDSDFVVLSGAAEDRAPDAEPAPSTVFPALANWDAPLASSGEEITEEDLAEAPAPFAWPAAAAVEDDIPAHAAIPGFDDEDEIFARARAMASAEAHAKPAHEKKGGFMSRLFGKKKAPEPVTDVGPGEWVSADVLDETDTPAWSMAGMAGGPPAAASLEDWELDPGPGVPVTGSPPAGDAPDEDDWAAKARATWASLDDANPPLAAVPAFEPPGGTEPPLSANEAPEEDDWAAKARATWAALDDASSPLVAMHPADALAWEPLAGPESESAGESPAPAAVAWEWPGIDAAMETESASSEHRVPTGDPGPENDFTWDPEEFGEEPAAVDQPAARSDSPAWDPERSAFDEPAATLPEPAFEPEPAAEPVDREPIPLHPAGASPDAAPAPPSFSFEPETPADDADPWAAFLSSREQERSASEAPREAARILPFDEPRLTDETTVSMVEPAALAAEPESASAPAGATSAHDEDRGWDAIASAFDSAGDPSEGGDDDDWNPEAFATATPVTAPEPDLPAAPAPPAFAWDDEDGEPEPAPAPIDIRAWGRTPAPVAAESFAPPPGSDWETDDPGATADEPPADDPWAAVAAASGFESDSPQGIAVYRGHAEHIAQHHDAWDDDSAAPAPDEDVVLRAFERHAATRDEDPEAAMPPLPLEPLLGREGVDVVDEVSPAEPAASHHGFSRLSGWAPQRTGDEHPVRPPLPRAGRSDPDEEWGFEDDQSIPPWARPSVAEGSPFDGPSEVAPRRRRTLIREIVETGLLAALVFLSVRASFQNFKVDGTSMYPTLENGQFLIVNKLVYSEVDVEKLSRFVPFVHPGADPRRNVFHGPERGDIIVLEHPNQPGTDLIKRVVGLPGETLEVVDGHVYINDRLLEEPYAPPHWGGSKPRIVIPAGEYYVMGDNRDNSADSRTLGTIPEDLIIGKAMVSYWPTNKFGLAPNASPDLTDQKPRLTAQRLGE